MNTPHQKYREIVFQILYGLDMGSTDAEELCTMLKKELDVSRKIIAEAFEKVELIREKLPEIDQKISETSVSYDLHRIHSVERNVLRLGIFELIYDASLPPKVVIAEAIRLSKKFGTPESVSYVNAIIDHIYKGIKCD